MNVFAITDLLEIGDTCVREVPARRAGGLRRRRVLCEAAYSRRPDRCVSKYRHNVGGEPLPRVGTDAES